MYLCLEPDREMTQSVFQPTFVKISDQHAINYDGIPEAVGQTSVYEQIILEKRQVVLNTTSEYAALKPDDYLNVETSI